MQNADLVKAIQARGAQALNEYRAAAGPNAVIDLTAANFDHLNLTGVNFSEVVLDGTSFKFAQMRDANFDHARMNGTDFTHADLTGTTFTEPRGQHCVFNHADLTRVHFSGGTFTDSWFVRTTMANVLAIDTDFRRSRFEETVIRGSVLSQNDFRGAFIMFAPNRVTANFTGCDLRGIRLTRAAQKVLLATLSAHSKRNLTTLKTIAMHHRAGMLIPDPRFEHCRSPGHDQEAARRRRSRISR